jgi:hypothetical protein
MRAFGVLIGELVNATPALGGAKKNVLMELAKSCEMGTTTANVYKALNSS